MGIKRALRTLAYEAVKAVVVEFATNCSQKAGEAMGQRIGKKLYPEWNPDGVPKEEEETDETTTE